MFVALLRSTNFNRTVKRWIQNSSATSRWLEPVGHDTGIKIYNPLVNHKVPLISQQKNVLTWYTCGPTVYDTSHIGHASCYVKVDIIHRILRNHFNINVVSAMNITDIDDKIINRSNELGISYNQMARQYETEFFEDLKNLGVLQPNIVLRVSDFIPQIIKFIEQLIANKSAYIAPDKSVYFRVASYPTYGKLSNAKAEDKTSDIKESIQDFVLWKATKPSEPNWPSPWGPGRPGWHIECSTLASFIFGSNVDVHAGGIDLRFPHHENEEAQSCGYHGCNQWVNYWLYAGKLALPGQEKMSKSLKNTISVNQLLQNYTPDKFRMACLLTNYRNPMNYTSELMQTATAVIKKFHEFDDFCCSYAKGQRTHVNFDNNDVYCRLSEISKSIDDSLKDDFNTASAIGSMIEIISFINKTVNNSNENSNQSASNSGTVIAVNNLLQSKLHLFGLKSANEYTAGMSQNISKIVDELLEVRSDLRKLAKKQKDKKLFALCDNIRERLKDNGIEIKDHFQQSTTWTYQKRA